MNVSFIVPVRNKAHFVKRTIKSIFDQTYSPMEIVLSDQGSEDNSLEILKDCAKRYSGPNTVRVIECPHTEWKGMAGLNTHMNWINTQIDSDIVIMSSADDLNHPHRAAETVKAFEQFDPSYVATMAHYIDGKGETEGFTSFPKESRFVTAVEHIDQLVGSSSSPAWRKDLWDKYPLQGIETEDVIMPFWGALEKGLYYIALPLYGHVNHADENNTGLEGRLKAAKSDEERGRIIELINYHVATQWFYILQRAEELQIKLADEVHGMLCQKALSASALWCFARNDLTMNRVDPSPFKV